MAKQRHWYLHVGPFLLNYGEKSSITGLRKFKGGSWAWFKGRLSIAYWPFGWGLDAGRAAIQDTGAHDER